jgi:hypothetical protein
MGCHDTISSPWVVTSPAPAIASGTANAPRLLSSWAKLFVSGCKNTTERESWQAECGRALALCVWIRLAIISQIVLSDFEARPWLDRPSPCAPMWPRVRGNSTRWQREFSWKWIVVLAGSSVQVRSAGRWPLLLSGLPDMVVTFFRCGVKRGRPLTYTTQ